MWESEWESDWLRNATKYNFTNRFLPSVKESNNRNIVTNVLTMPFVTTNVTLNPTRFGVLINVVFVCLEIRAAFRQCLTKGLFWVPKRHPIATAFVVLKSAFLRETDNHEIGISRVPAFPIRSLPPLALATFFIFARVSIFCARSSFRGAFCAHQKATPRSTSRFLFVSFR